MYASLADFIDALDHAGELRRVAAPVSPLLEVAEVADRVSKSQAPFGPTEGARLADPRFHDRGGAALLFEDVEGSDFPLLINAYGSYRRTEMALGCHDEANGLSPGHTPGGFEGIAARIGALVKPEPPKSLGEAVEAAKRFAPLLKIGPRRSRRAGACQEVVRTGEAVDLRRLPIPRCWPLDGDFAAMGYPEAINDGLPGVDARDASIRGRYITFAGIHTIHADDEGEARPSSHNIGMYRVQLLGPRTLAMHWHVHHDGASHWRSWKRAGRPMPVAIALGGESVLPYAATCPLPPGISELLMAGFLNRGGIRLCRAKTVPLWVPANAEIVIEGYVSHEAGPIGYDPRSGEPLGPGAVFEGPFGDHTGFYSMPDRYPVVRVTAVTHRKRAVFPTTIVGLPPQEDYYLGKATERIMSPLLKTLIHDIEDYDLPLFGAFHNCAVVKIRKQYPLHARRVMHAVWGAGQMSWTKAVFVVDADVDPHDTFAVLRAAAANCRPDRDVERVRGPLDILDHAAPELGAGMKTGFDCTPRWPGEGADGSGAWSMPPGDGDALLERVRSIPGVLDASLPEALGRGWLLVRAEPEATPPGPTPGARVVRAILDGGGAPPFVVVVGPEADVADADDALFHWLANADASRDATIRDGTIAFDAMPKSPDDSGTEDRPGVREWPPLIRMSDDVRARVDERWADYGV